MSELSSNRRTGKTISRRELLKWMGTASAGAVLAACAPQQPAASQPQGEAPQQSAPQQSAPVDIVFHARAGNQSIWDPEMNGFNKAQSKAVVKVEYTPDAEYEQKLSTLAAAGQLGDTYYNIIFGTLYPFASSGIHRDLDDLLAADPELKLTDFFEAAPKMATWNGKLVGMPINIHPGWTSMWTNVDMFEAAGMELPQWEWTFEKEWRDAVKAVNEPGTHFGTGLEYNAQQALLFIRSWGGDWIDAETQSKATITDEKTVAALRFWRDLIEVDKVAPRMDEIANGTRDMFINQKVASYSQGVWEEGSLSSTIEDKFKWQAFPMPAGPGGRGTFIGMDTVSINKKSENAAEAYSWIKYLLGKESALRVKANGFVPTAIKAHWSDPSIADNVNLNPVRQWLEVAQPWTVPGNARVVEFRNAIAQGIQAVLNPANDFQAEVEKLQTAAQAVLSQPAL